MTPPENPFNNEEEPESPFGFNFDPNSIQEMMSSMLSGATGAQSDPMSVAERVAADIAAREIEETYEDEPEQAPDAVQAADPMAEIMQIMNLMATPPVGKAPTLEIDANFADRCTQIYPAAQNYIAAQAQTDDVTSIPLVVTDRVTWTKDYISSLQRPLAQASKSLSPTMGGGDDEQDISDPESPFGFDIQSLIAKSVAPMMFGVQAGTMLGYLSHRAYGDDDVLLPTTLPVRVGLIASAVQKFADEWSVPIDEAILYFLILQTVRAHLRKGSWLTSRLEKLCTDYVAAYELNPYKLEELMSDVDMTSPDSVMAVNVTPEQMFETLRTPQHDILDEEIGRISSLHDAYVEWVLHKGIEPLLPNYRIIQEARRRITVTTSSADRFVEQLFGVAVTEEFRTRGQAFVDGVIEREREDLLHALWSNEEMIPTESEFAAPGLWIARLELA